MLRKMLVVACFIGGLSAIAWADLTDSSQVVKSVRHTSSGQTEIVIHDFRPHHKKVHAHPEALTNATDFHEVNVVSPGPSLRAAQGYAPTPQVDSPRSRGLINYSAEYAPGPSAGYAANRNPSYGSSILSTGPVYGYSPWYGYGYDSYGFGYGLGYGAPYGRHGGAYRSSPSGFFTYNPLSPTSAAINIRGSYSGPRTLP
jgi:hypothetical protein